MVSKGEDGIAKRRKIERRDRRVGMKLQESQAVQRILDNSTRILDNSANGLFA